MKACVFIVLGVFAPITQGYTLFGNGVCTDSGNNEYDRIAWRRSDISTVADCANKCLEVDGFAANPGVGFNIFDSINPTSNWCICLYSNGDLDSVQTTDFTPAASFRNIGQSGTGAISNLKAGSYFCYTFATGCDARVLAALDRTYVKDAIDNVDDAKDMLSLIVDKFEFGPDAAFGILNLLQHSVKWRVGFDKPASTDKTLLQQELATLGGAWRHRATNFWRLFTGAGDVVSDASVPSYIIIFSDGRLLYRRNWRGQLKKKNQMAARLGANMPQVLCFSTRSVSNTKFFLRVCDQIYYRGMDSKTDDEIAQDIVDLMCAVP